MEKQYLKAKKMCKLKMRKVINNFKRKIRDIKNHKLTVLETLFLLLIISVASFFSGYIYNNRKNTEQKLVVVDKYISKFIENYNYVIENYYEDVDKGELIDGAIAGMMDSLDDPYSAYLDSSTSMNMNITLNGSYNGLGVAVSKSDDDHYVEVVAVFKDSPAFKANLKEGDIIKKVNDIDIYDMSVADFSNLVLTNKDDNYNLEILRDGKEITKSLEKHTVTIDSVTSKLIEKNDKKIGYIYISVFASNTALQFLKELNDLELTKLDALIIDVRNNTGGHLKSVEKILKHFLTKKQIIYQMQKGRDIMKFYGAAKENKDYEIVIIGNCYSASASEILISGLRENLNSKYIGEKSYGNGTVQEVVTLSNNKQYKITTKKWLTPNGNFVSDTKGIFPDIEVKATGTDLDIQLNEALDYLLQTN